MAAMDYFDFELEIGLGRGRNYPVAVVRSEMGEARETMRFPFDKLALDNRLLTLENALLRSGETRRRILSPDDQTVQDFGQALFNALFTGEVRHLYGDSRRVAEQQGRGLRIKLRIQPPELAALPWEFLYDPGRGEYVCFSRHTPIVRYMDLPHSRPPLIVMPPLRILGMMPHPKELADLDVDRERQRVETAIAPLEAQGLVDLIWLEGHSWYDLQKAMRGGPWHILHFIGHGDFDPNTDEGRIALEDEDGCARYMSATQLGRLLSDHRPLRLVVLNACEGARGSERDLFSSSAGALVRQGIPAVLAMQYEITDRAAIELSRVFYDALAEGLPVDAAVSEARKAISLAITNTVEWGTPVLYMRSPDGRLFDMVAGRGEDALGPEEPGGGGSALSPEEPGGDSSGLNIGMGPIDEMTHEPAGDVALASMLEPHWELHLKPLSSFNEPQSSSNTAAAFSPDGQFLAFGTREKTVCLYQVADGTILRILRGHRNIVTSVGFSPDGKLLASGADDGSVRLWQVADGMALRTLEGRAGSVTSVAFSPDGEMLASGDAHVQLWRVADGVPLRTLRGSGATQVTSVAFSPDGETLASCAEDKTVHLWRIADGVLLRTIKGHAFWVKSVAFSPNGQYLAFADGRTVRIWRFTDGTVLHSLEGHIGGVTGVAFSPDGEMLVSCAEDKTVRLWRVIDGAPLSTSEKRGQPAYSIAFSPDGQTLALAPGAPELGTPTRVSPTKAESVQSANESGAIRLVHVSFVPGLARSVSTAFSPDRQLLACGEHGNEVRLYKVSDGTLLRSSDSYSSYPVAPAFSPDGQILASSEYWGIVRLWRVVDGTVWRKLKRRTGFRWLGITESITCVAFSPDGELLASGADDKTVRLWRVANGMLLRTLEGHKGRVTDVAFSPDGEILASCAEDETVRLWRVADGSLIGTLDKHFSRVCGVAFLPHGRTLISCATDQTVLSWEVQ